MSKMARQANILFLEEWLRSNSGRSGIGTTSHASSTSARGIIQAWTDLRDLVQRQLFEARHLQSLQTLVDSQVSLHVADPQAKLLVSILSFWDLVLPLEAYPLLLRLLYIWIRKSFRPSSELIESMVNVLSTLLASEFDSKKSPKLFSEGALILGATSFVSSASETSKTVCLRLLCQLVEDEYALLNSFEELIPDVLAGIGYALCSSVNVHYVRILDACLGIWGKENGPRPNICHGLMILHLVEWAVSSYITLRSQEKLQIFMEEALEKSTQRYIHFTCVMAAAGALRALSRSTTGGGVLEIVSRMRRSAENQLESVAKDLVSKTRGFSDLYSDYESLLLQCISLAVARCRSVSPHAFLLISLASALVREIFPLQLIYSRILQSAHDGSGFLTVKVKEHVDSVLFKEAGAITSVFCNQYALIDEENKCIVESIIWSFCQQLYLGHRKVAFLLRGKQEQLLVDIEKIAESAFLMVVFFALAVTKHKLNSKFTTETQMETSVSVLYAFSFVEYFRRMRLIEYMDAIRGAVLKVQENENPCISFVESMPSYADITHPKDLMQRSQYVWFRDEVQTARILFYLRVIPTCINCLPGPVFTKVVAPTMFLYIGHPNGKVARAAHSVCAAFMSSGKDSNDNERSSLKEKLAFYYIQRSLEGYPGNTPFEGLASGVAALVRNLPAGSRATFYCIHSLVEKAKTLCIDLSRQDPNFWKDWQGDSNPTRKFIELLLRLLSLVDIQVLPNLMRSLAELIVQLPKDGQNVVLDELYAQVAESEDATRKPTLISWLQSMSYLCSEVPKANTASKGMNIKENISKNNSSDGDGISARL